MPDSWDSNDGPGAHCKDIIDPALVMGYVLIKQVVLLELTVPLQRWMTDAHGQK